MDDGIEDAQLMDVDETTIPLMEAELRLFEHDKKTLENIYMPERHKFHPVMNRVKEGKIKQIIVYGRDPEVFHLLRKVSVGYLPTPISMG